MWLGNWFDAPIFKESTVKKSGEVCMQIWTNLDSFANSFDSFDSI